MFWALSLSFGQNALRDHDASRSGSASTCFGSRCCENVGMRNEMRTTRPDVDSDLAKFGRVILIAFFVFLAWIHAYFFGLLGTAAVCAWLCPSAKSVPLIEIGLLISVVVAGVTLRCCLKGIWRPRGG